VAESQIEDTSVGRAKKSDLGGREDGVGGLPVNAADTAGVIVSVL